MVLQTLEGRPNILDMDTRIGLPAQPKYEPSLDYRLLKRDYFDHARGLWVERQGSALFLETSAQLVGVLAEKLLYGTDIRKLYTELERMACYGENRVWSLRPFDRTISPSNPALFDCMVIQELDPNLAAKKFKQVKERFFEEAWAYRLVEEDDSTRFEAIEDQLLGTYVEGFFDKDTARSFYAGFKTGKFYNAKDHTWYTREGAQHHRYTVLQLYGVLAESHFDPDKAISLYDGLKKEQYDRALCSGQSLPGAAIQASNEIFVRLLAVLVEARLAEILGESLTQPVPPMPAIRRF